MPDGEDHIHQHDVEAVNSTARRTLYKKREPVYPKRVSGKYRFIKWALLFFTLGVYYGLPWLRWDRGPNEPSQAVLVDFEGPRFYFFFLEIWPSELYFLTGLLVLSALALFFVTSLFGRLWCGYACPQTVWTDLFVAIERFVEGDRNKRMRLAKQSWNVEKITKKAIKHFLWLLTAAATGGAWVLYFHDAPTVIGNLLTGQAPMSAYLFMGILTFTTYALAGTMREQVCIYMCPWPRIQAAMTDADTFSVGYYVDRGEPRGKHKKGASWEGRGDCVDCKACVVVCPMGIDIRDGDQLECINCGLCADACDDIMRKVGRPTGLIGYGADYRLESPDGKHRLFPKLFRARTLFYAVAIGIVGTLMLAGLFTRTTVEFGVERNRAPAYTVLSDGSVRNAVTVRILNKKSAETPYRVTFAGANVEVTAVGREVENGSFEMLVPGDELQHARVFLTMPQEVQDNENIVVTLTDPVTGEERTQTITFIRGN